LYPHSLNNIYRNLWVWKYGLRVYLQIPKIIFLINSLLKENMGIRHSWWIILYTKRKKEKRSICLAFIPSSFEMTVLFLFYMYIYIYNIYFLFDHSLRTFINIIIYTFVWKVTVPRPTLTRVPTIFYARYRWHGMMQVRFLRSILLYIRCASAKTATFDMHTYTRVH